MFMEDDNPYMKTLHRIPQKGIEKGRHAETPGNSLRKRSDLQENQPFDGRSSLSSLIFRIGYECTWVRERQKQKMR